MANGNARLFVSTHQRDLVVARGHTMPSDPKYFDSAFLSGASLPYNRTERQLAEKQRWLAAYQDCDSSVGMRNVARYVGGGCGIQLRVPATVFAEIGISVPISRGSPPLFING